jgi:ribosomal protein S18 acetylase RimI-like enzyme
VTTIRPATGADIAAVVATDSFAVNHPVRADEIAAWIAAGQCVLAEHAGRVAGYAVLTEGFFHRPFVEMLMVDERTRRRGIGAALLDHCATLAGTELWTSTNASNTPMRALLVRRGFTESGRIDNLDPGDPEIVYLRRP